MRILKSTIILLCFILTACGDNTDTVPRAEYEDILSEYEELRQITADTQKAYITQANQVNEIMTSLSQISSQTAQIRLNVENGTGKLTQIEQIQGNIKSVKERIEELEKIADSVNGLNKIISGLKKVVEEKDHEIYQLKKQISIQEQKIQEQKATIQEQSGTINAQMETILKQKNELEQEVRKQAIMLYNAGLAFENLGDDSPEIKRKKDRAKVDNLTREMYENALQYYKQAYSAGHDEALTRINIVSRKLQLI